MAEPTKRSSASSKREERRTRANRSAERKERRQRKKRGVNKRFIALVAVIIIIAAGIFSVVGKNATQFSVNGAVICTVKRSGVTSKDITNTVTALLADEYGSKVKINEEIVLNNVHAPKKELVTMEYALSRLKQVVTYKVEAAVITVDGEKTAVMANTESAQEVLNSIIQDYIPEGKEMAESGFVQNVSVDSDFVDSGEIMSAEETKKKLTVGSPVTKKYTVGTGDTIYKIAAKADITVEELLKANPSLTLDSVLKLGQELNLTVMEPFLSVKTAENVVYTEKQEKEVVYKQDSSKPTTYKKVTQQGKDGQKEVTSQIIRINGFESEEKIVSEKTTVQPVDEIIVVGTKQ